MKHLSILTAFIMFASFSFNIYGQKKMLNKKPAILQISRIRLVQLK